MHASASSALHISEQVRIPPSAEAPSILECNGVRKSFGGITAIQDISLTLRDGEILGLIGHNGAGKTTFFDCVSGFLPLDGGRIRLGGVDIDTWPAHVRATAGLGRTFQEARLFPSLTVAETIAVAHERHLESREMVAAGLRLPASLDSEASVKEKSEALIDLMGLDAFREKLVGELSTGTRRIVELACVLAQEPGVLLLDEPSGGVAQRETEAMGPAAGPGAAAHRLLDLGGRARHAPAHRHLRPHDRPGAGRGHRRGHAGAGARAPGRHRVLSGHRRVHHQSVGRSGLSRSTAAARGGRHRGVS